MYSVFKISLEFKTVKFPAQYHNCCAVIMYENFNIPTLISFFLF